MQKNKLAHLLLRSIGACAFASVLACSPAESDSGGSKEFHLTDPEGDCPDPAVDFVAGGQEALGTSCGQPGSWGTCRGASMRLPIPMAR